MYTFKIRLVFLNIWRSIYKLKKYHFYFHQLYFYLFKHFLSFCWNINDLNEVYKLKKTVGSNNFSAQFIKIISHYKNFGYNISVLQQTACLVVNPIKVGNFAFLFNCTSVGRTSDSMMVPT